MMLSSAAERLRRGGGVLFLSLALAPSASRAGLAGVVAAPEVVSSQISVLWLMALGLIGVACLAVLSLLLVYGDASARQRQRVIRARLNKTDLPAAISGVDGKLYASNPAMRAAFGDMRGDIVQLLGRGIEVNAETLSFENIKEVCFSGEGHYLGSDRTLGVMQSEYIYPEFSDRTSPLQWEENEKPVILERAIAKRNDILQSYFPQHVSDEADLRIREEFPIKLSREAIGRS